MLRGVVVGEGVRPVTPLHLGDAGAYYRTFVNRYDGTVVSPYDNFNKIEITFSHLFREPNQLIGGQTYGGALRGFFAKHRLLGSEIAEIGGGLGDVMRCILEADAGQTISRCKMIDISPKLRAAQRESLAAYSDGSCSFEEGDCEAISQVLRGTEQLVLCNGVIADLTADRLDEPRSIDGLDDNEIAEFARLYLGSCPYWLPTGTLKFVKELSKSLSPSGAAFLTEYEKTSDNQPAFFDNHHECGIDFRLVQAFARLVGLEAELFDVSEIIGFDAATPLLTIDYWTKRSTVLKMHGAKQLGRLSSPLRVAAYSRETLEQILSSQLSSREVSVILEALAAHFHPIDAIAFDTKNPTTWTYKALLLRRKV